MSHDARETIARSLCDNFDARLIALQIDADMFDDSSEYVQGYWRTLADGVLATLSPDPVLLGEVREASDALEWLGSKTGLALDHYSPMYGDDDDLSREWRVTEENGSINDREWTILGRGETPLAAILAARAALAKLPKLTGEEV